SPITLTVNVAANASSSVTNQAKVSGGGEQNTGNDIASDPATVIPRSGGNAQLVSDPCIPGKSALLVSGTPGADTIQLSSAGGVKITVLINGANLGTFKPTGLIIALGQAGDDSIN